MQNTQKATEATCWKQVREKLFPLLQQTPGLDPTELTDKLKTLAQILEIVRIEQFVPEPQRGTDGKRKRGGQEIDRRPLARAFVAKAFLNLSQTRALKEQLDQCSALRKLCGMATAPSEATFSRAFSQFAQMRLGQFAHAALVEKFAAPQSASERLRSCCTSATIRLPSKRGRRQSRKPS